MTPAARIFRTRAAVFGIACFVLAISGCGAKDALLPDTSCVVEPAVLDFGSTYPTVASTRTAYVVNRGAKPFTLTAAVDAPEFSLADGSLPLTVDPGDTLALDVAFRAASAGSYGCRLTVTGAACGSIECVAVAAGSVHVVQAAGSGNYATIQQAIDAAADGDLVQLGDGIFTGTGNWEIDFRGKALVLGSASGDPEACRIRGSALRVNAHRVLQFITGEGPGTVVRDVTIENGYGWTADGGGVLIEAASPRFERVRFVGNRTTNDGGAVHVSGACRPEFRDCVFAANVAGYDDPYLAGQVLRLGGFAGGAIFADVATDASFEVRGSVFLDNRCYYGSGGAICGSGQIFDSEFAGNLAVGVPGSGGAIYLQGGDVVGCVLRNNTASHQAAAAYLTAANLSGCTIVANSVSEAYGAAVYTEVDVAIRNSIVGFNGPLGIDGFDTPYMLCCDYYGNGDTDGGFVMGALDGDGNFVAEPRFVDRAAGDLHLAADSPCLPGQHPDGADCGLIGARTTP